MKRLALGSDAGVVGRHSSMPALLVEARGLKA